MLNRLSVSVVLGICGLALAVLSAQRPAPPREEAYRANNLGVAYLEQYNYDKASAQFRQALEIEPTLMMARVNLAIALLYTPDLEGATREAKAALRQQEDEPHAHYVLGLIARSENRVDDGIAAFKRVLAIDPRDVGALVNLGQLLMQRREYAEAVALFRRAAEQEPFHVTATYNLAVALTRSGQTDEGQRMTQQFQKLRESGYGTTFANAYLEQGRYAEAIVSTGAEPELVNAATPDVSFAPLTTINASASAARASTAQAAPAPAAPAQAATAQAPGGAAAGGGVTLADLDGDGDLDLIDVSPSGVRLFRNDNGTFTDVTAQTGIGQLASPAVPIAAIAGDYDNDEKTDIFVLGNGANALYRQTAPWTFEDVTAKSGVSTGAAISGTHPSAALVDVDHDGDLDLFLVGGGSGSAGNVLLRNNADGTFTDITTMAKVAQAGQPAARGVAIAPTDYDNRRDVDLLLVAQDHAPTLFRNMRDGTFQDVAKEAGLATEGTYTCVAAGDVNKDGFTDFFFGRADAPGLLMLSDGSTHFRAAAADNAPAAANAIAAQFIDYDNDGLLDLVIASADGLHIWRNLGRSWADVTDATVKAFNATLTPTNANANATATATATANANANANARRIAAFAAGDFTGDGATDLAIKLRSGELVLLRNRGGSKNPSMRVRLAGRVSNRDGIGSKVEIRAGSLFQKLETSSATPAIAPADLVFGLGSRAKADVVRVLWPSGVLQAEPQESASPAVTVKELDRKPSSCPFLFTWNGERFEFITDFMGGGEMGDYDGVQFNTSDPEEYTRIRGDQLRPRNGRYEIRVTNELEETLYADRFELLAIDHPADEGVYPHEGLFSPPFPEFELFAARNVRPPAAIYDHAGANVMEKARALDRQFIDNLPLEPRFRGYAQPHELIIDTSGDADADVLLLTGWTDYAFSSDNVAATQAGLEMQPPSLDVLDNNGRWHTVMKEIGIPVGRPQTLVVNMKGKWLSNDQVVRIRTNMRIYWDQIQVATLDPQLPARKPKITHLDPIAADLHWRGFSAEATREEPFTYDYARVSRVFPWKQMPGRYTREGDVRPLLLSVDDMFVVSRPGDEIALSFDATRLPPLPRGWTRTFLLHSDGFSKEMNPRSSSPDFAAPLPFHTMTRYPYGPDESYPLTPERQRYIERYNTRVVGKSLPPLEAAGQQN